MSHELLDQSREGCVPRGAFPTARPGAGVDVHFGSEADTGIVR
jgi:hypothetical protein